MENVVLSLVSGLVGVVLGAVITLARDRQQDARLDRGAARVTFFELSANTAMLEAAIKYGVTTPLQTSTWAQTRSRIAQVLGPADLAVVATAYLKIEVTQNAWNIVGLGTPVVSKAAAQDAFDRADTASNILERVGWPDERDRQELKHQLAGHIKPKP